MKTAECHSGENENASLIRRSVCDRVGRWASMDGFSNAETAGTPREKVEVWKDVLLILGSVHKT
jgi:hypothetical protein